jgi:Zn-dependent protease
VEVAAGPVAVLAASQVALAAFCFAYPADREALRLNHPSDVLRGVVAPTMGEELILSIAVGLLCFGLLSLVPIPPLDGYRLVRLALESRDLRADRRSGAAAALAADTATPVVVDRVGVVLLLALLVVPVGGAPPLVRLLDLVGAPLMGLWA